MRSLCALALLAASSLPAAAAENCQYYRGSLVGNSAGVLEIAVCGDQHVTGTCTYRHDVYGWDTRACEGDWDGDHLVLHDTKMLEMHMLTSIRLCSADRYDLDRAGGGTLSGSYDSAECDDHGQLQLHDVITTVTITHRATGGPGPLPLALFAGGLLALALALVARRLGRGAIVPGA